MARFALTTQPHPCPDEPGLAAKLRIEERELEGGGLNELGGRGVQHSG
jgi:hypothetical protein